MLLALELRDSDVEREAELVYVQFLGVGSERSVVRWVASEVLRCKTVASRVFFFSLRWVEGASGILIFTRSALTSEQECGG